MKRNRPINLLPGPHLFVYNPNLKKTTSGMLFRQDLAKWLRNFSRLLFGIGAVLAILTFGPRLYGWATASWESEWVQVLTRPSKSFGETLVESGDKAPKPMYQPVFDPTLPRENRLLIPDIGVDSPIGENEAEHVEEALRQGVWRVPDFGTPFDRKYATILAAHRFGYLEWNNAFRRARSFYNLPKLKPGDRIEVIWDQRKYVYEVTGGEEGKEITNYQADLILYTCKFLNSDDRIFTYATLLEI